MQLVQEEFEALQDPIHDDKNKNLNNNGIF